MWGQHWNCQRQTSDSAKGIPRTRRKMRKKEYQLVIKKVSLSNVSCMMYWNLSPNLKQTGRIMRLALWEIDYEPLDANLLPLEKRPHSLHQWRSNDFLSPKFIATGQCKSGEGCFWMMNPLFNIKIQTKRRYGGCLDELGLKILSRISDKCYDLQYNL